MDYSSNEGSRSLLVAGLQQELRQRLTNLESLSSIRPKFAAGQQEAINIAHKGRPDLAVVNRRLSDGDGLTVTSLLREIWPGLTVILTGRDSDAGEELEAYASGASLYLPQPLDPGHLAQVILCCLDRAKGANVAPA